MRTTARSSRGSEEWPGHFASEQHDSLAQGSLAAGEEGSQRPGGARTRSASAQPVGSSAQFSIHRVVRQRTDDRDVGHAAAHGGVRRGRDSVDEVDSSGRRVAPRLRRVDFLLPAESSVARSADGAVSRGRPVLSGRRQMTRSTSIEGRLSAPSRQHDLLMAEATAVALGRAMASEEVGDPPAFDGRTGMTLWRHWAAPGVERAARWPELYARAGELTQQVLQELAGETSSSCSGIDRGDDESLTLTDDIVTWSSGQGSS